MPKHTKEAQSNTRSLTLSGEYQIYIIRGQKVMLDQDLAKLYEVGTKVFNQAIKRNLSRFPKDFMFQLTNAELHFLRSQIVISNDNHGGRRYLPYVFTEQDVGMLSSVLNSERAIQVNIAIIRAFVKMRQMILSNEVLLRRLEQLEQKTDDQFKIVFEVIKRLIEEDEKPKGKIGFRTNEK